MGKFYRVRKNAILGGVCSGLAEYFGNPNLKWLIRILFLLFSINISVVIYALIWTFAEEKYD